jgi:hypothetical protein
MKPYEILKYIWQSHRRLCKPQIGPGLTLKFLRKLLGNSTTDGSISRTLTDKATNQDAIHGLERRSVQQQIESRIGIKGLFAIKSLSELEALVMGATASTEDAPIFLEHRSVGDGPLEGATPRASTEVIVARALAKLVHNSINKSIVYWRMRPFVGANFVA